MFNFTVIKSDALLLELYLIKFLACNFYAARMKRFVGKRELFESSAPAAHQAPWSSKYDAVNERPKSEFIRILVSLSLSILESKRRKRINVLIFNLSWPEFGRLAVYKLQTSKDRRTLC